MMDRQSIMGVTALALALALPSFSGAIGAEKPLTHDGDRSKKLLIRPYLAPTGAVVAKPGQPQSGPESAQQKKAQEQSNKIINSICSNC